MSHEKCLKPSFQKEFPLKLKVSRELSVTEVAILDLKSSLASIVSHSGPSFYTLLLKDCF